MKITTISVWKNPETAPKDGTPFLARFKKSNLIEKGVTVVHWKEYPDDRRLYPQSQWELTHPGVHSEDDSTGEFEAWAEIPT